MDQSRSGQLQSAGAQHDANCGTVSDGRAVGNTKLRSFGALRPAPLEEDGVPELSFAPSDGERHIATING